MQAHEAVANLTFGLGFGHQRGDGVHHHYVDGPGRDERAGDLESLLAIVGLGDEQVVDVHAELACVNGIESMLCVEKGGRSARRLGLGR